MIEDLSNMKMTTEVPEGIATPDRLEHNFPPVWSARALV